MNRMPVSLEIAVTGEAEAEGARRATGASASPVEPVPRVPDPEVRAKVERRRFSVEYRRRIVKQADACKKHGEIGALLRREGLYASHLITWRRQREQGELAAGRARTRGPMPKPVDPRVKPLEIENRRLQRKDRKSTRLNSSHRL